MSCTGIISIPLCVSLCAGCHSKQAEQAGEACKAGKKEADLLWFSSAGHNRVGHTGCSKACHNFYHLFKVKLRQQAKAAAVSRAGQTTCIPQMSAPWKRALLKSPCVELLSLQWKR